MNKQQIAYNYLNACYTQRCYEDQVNKALQLLNPDNQVFGLSDHMDNAYTSLIQELLGTDIFDWLLWWQYDCDYGKIPRGFAIDNIQYNTEDMTQLKFLELVIQ